MSYNTTQSIVHNAIFGDDIKSLNINPNHVFATNALRDTYFQTHLSELRQGKTNVYITGDKKLYVWNGSNNPSTYSSTDFHKITPAIKGG